MSARTRDITEAEVRKARDMPGTEPGITAPTAGRRAGEHVTCRSLSACKHVINEHCYRAQPSYDLVCVLCFV